MTTHFITAEIDLNTVKTDLQQVIEDQLSVQGESLRWAITAVEAGKAQVEAVALKEDVQPVT